MKITSKCCKCGSGDFVRIPMMAGAEPRIAVGEFGMHMVPITRVVCTRCGFIEQWISNPDDVEKLKREYGQTAMETP